MAKRKEERWGAEGRNEGKGRRWKVEGKGGRKVKVGGSGKGK